MIIKTIKLFFVNQFEMCFRSELQLEVQYAAITLKRLGPDPLLICFPNDILYVPKVSGYANHLANPNLKTNPWTGKLQHETRSKKTGFASFFASTFEKGPVKNCNQF